MPSQVKLSVKQEMFILFVLKGEAQSKAYTLAGYKAANDEVAKVNASKLLTTHNVKTRLDELRQAIQVRTVVTVETLTEMLFEDRDQAKKEGKVNAAVSALALIAKMHGLLIDRSESVIMHRPSPLPTQLLELSEEEWRQQFSLKSPENTEVITSPTNVDK